MYMRTMARRDFAAACSALVACCSCLSCSARSSSTSLACRSRSRRMSSSRCCCCRCCSCSRAVLRRGGTAGGSGAAAAASSASSTSKMAQSNNLKSDRRESTLPEVAFESYYANSEEWEKCALTKDGDCLCVRLFATGGVLKMHDGDNNSKTTEEEKTDSRSNYSLGNACKNHERVSHSCADSY